MPPRRAKKVMKISLAVPAQRVNYRKRGQIARSIISANPTFTETFHSRDATFGDFTVTSGSGVGRVFKVRISDIPQISQYATLYRQYKINSVKVMVIPDFNTESSDVNQALANATVPTGFSGMARVVYATNTTPGVVAPATEDELLEDNGCKIHAVKSKWSVKMTPTPDIALTTSTGVIPIKATSKQWFNFDTTTTTNNPLHGAVSSYWSLPGSTNPIEYNVYYKVNFSLRDPQ